MGKVTAFEEHVEADHYHNAPDRDFAHTGEAFRLRRVGPASCLTYKGPRQDSAVKVRPEIEVPLSWRAKVPPRTCCDCSVISAIGRLCGGPQKRAPQSARSAVAVSTLTVCLDDVEGVGQLCRSGGARFARATDGRPRSAGRDGRGPGFKCRGAARLFDNVAGGAAPIGAGRVSDGLGRDRR